MTTTETELETLRYPIGKFSPPENITQDDIRNWINEIATLPAKLQAVISRIDQAELDTRYREGGWTVRQVVNHMADSHLNAFVRFKLTLTEDNPTIKPYKEALWAELPDAKSVDVKYSQLIIENLHHRWVTLLRSMKESDFNRTYFHPEQNKNVPLRNVLALYAWHGNHHLAHIKTLPIGWVGKLPAMKTVFLSISSLLFCSFYSYSQLYEMDSNRNMDLSSKSIRMEKVHFTLDSNRVSLHTGDQTFYLDKKTFNIDDNGVINMIVLDKNDDEVMIKFSPGGKILDYYLHDAGLRYFLDKVEQPQPEQDSATAKKDTTSDEEKEVRLDTMIYDAAEVMPEYPGGRQEMMNYLSKNVKYPAAAKKAGVKGFAQVDIIVEKDGSIKYRKVRKDPGGGCGDEALRVVKAMPKWTPGENKGEAVRVRVSIPVSFMPLK